MANGFTSVEFFGAYLVLLFFTGAFIPVTLAFFGALGISFLIRTKLTEKREPVPANAAIVITGCSTGLGADASIQFSNEGFTVFAMVRKQADAEKLLSQAPGDAKARLIPVLCDITDKSQLQAAQAEVKKQIIQRGLFLHSLINNAGVGDSNFLELITLENLRRQYEINVFAQVAVTQAFLPLLRQDAPAGSTLSRRLVFVSSGVGHITVATAAPYCSTKHALESLVDGFRQELKAWNIDVVSVAPGRIETSFGSTARSNATGNLDQAKKQHGGEFAVADDVLHVYENMQQKVIQKNQAAKGGDVSLVTEAFRIALLAKHPPTRVPAGNDCVYGVPLALWLPDKLRDKALALR